MQLSLQRRALVVSIINMVLSTINIVLITPFAFMGFGFYAMYFNLSASNPPDSFSSSRLANQLLTWYALVGLILCLINLVLSIVLLVGAHKRMLRHLRIWYVGTIVLTVVFVARSLADVVLASIYGNNAYIIGSISYFLIGGFYTLFVIWIVSAFIKEMETGVPVGSVVIGMDEEPAHNPYQKLEE